MYFPLDSILRKTKPLCFVVDVEIITKYNWLGDSFQPKKNKSFHSLINISIILLQPHDVWQNFNIGYTGYLMPVPDPFGYQDLFKVNILIIQRMEGIEQFLLVSQNWLSLVWHHNQPYHVIDIYFY